MLNQIVSLSLSRCRACRPITFFRFQPTKIFFGRYKTHRHGSVYFLLFYTCSCLTCKFRYELTLSLVSINSNTSPILYCFEITESWSICLYSKKGVIRIKIINLLFYIRFVHRPISAKSVNSSLHSINYFQEIILDPVL